MYPEGEDILVVGLGRGPAGVLAGLVRGNEVHEVKRGVK